MEKDQQDQEPSGASKQEGNQEQQTTNPSTSAQTEVKETKENIEDAKEKVEDASETAPSNEMKASLASIADSLGRIEQGLTGLGSKVDAALPKAESKKEHKTPEVKVDSSVHYVKVRKRGGRVVTRQVENKK